MTGHWTRERFFQDPLVFLGLAVLSVISTVIGFLPTIIGRNKRNCRAILALNFFAGWTFVGWIVALVWACSEDSDEDEARARPLDAGAVVAVFAILNLAVFVAVWQLAGRAERAAASEMARMDAERAAADEERARVERDLRDAERARWDAERARAEYEALPKWDSYGKPINRESGGPAQPEKTADAIFPPGVETAEERRAYLRALTEKRKEERKRDDRWRPPVGRVVGR